VLPFVVDSEPFTFLFNYGVAGIVIVLLVTGHLRTKAEVAGLQKALDDATERERQKDIALANLMLQITQHTVPQLRDLARVVEALPPQQSEVDSTTLIDELRRRLDEIEQVR
jgi:hypothetical protein